MSVWLFLPLILVFLYPLIKMWALKATSASRDRFADNLKALLSDHTVSEDHKVFISSMADDIFDWRFLAFATVTFPTVAFSSHGRGDLSAQDQLFFDRSDVKELMDDHLKSVLAVSPLLTALFLIVAILTVLFVVVFVGFSVVSMLWGDTVKHVSPKVSAQRASIVSH